MAEPNETPQTPLSDVTNFVGAFARFSFERKIEFELQFRDEIIGDIENGEISSSIKEGLLDSW